MSQGKLGGSGGGQGGGGDLMTVLFGNNYQSLFGGQQGQQNTGGMPGSNPSMPSGDFTMPQMNTPNFGSIGGDLDTMFGQAQQNIAQPTFNAPSSGPQAIMYEGPKRTFRDEPLIPAPQYQTPQQPVQQPQQRAPMQPRAPQRPPQQRPQQRPAAPGNSLINRAVGAGTGAANRAIDGAVQKGVGGAIQKGVGYGTGAMGGLFGDSAPDYTYDDSAGGLYGPTPDGGNINDQYGYDDSYGYDQGGSEYTGGQDYGGFYDTEPTSNWDNWGGVQEFNTPDFSLDTSQMDWGDSFSFDQPNWDLDFGGFETPSFDFDMDFGGDWF